MGVGKGGREGGSAQKRARGIQGERVAMSSRVERVGQERVGKLERVGMMGEGGCEGERVNGDGVGLSKIQRCRHVIMLKIAWTMVHSI